MLPFDSKHLTEVESNVQREQERAKCGTCDWLIRRKRSGARVCEKGNDPGPVLVDPTVDGIGNGDVERVEVGPDALKLTIGGGAVQRPRPL